MKDVYICRKCGFVSTIRRAFVSVRFFDEFGDYTYGHECGACYAEEPAEAPANIQQQVQPDNSPKMCEECGQYPADLPSNLCCGYVAYKEHLS